MNMSSLWKLPPETDQHAAVERIHQAAGGLQNRNSRSFRIDERRGLDWLLRHARSVESMNAAALIGF